MLSCGNPMTSSLLSIFSLLCNDGSSTAPPPPGSHLSSSSRLPEAAADRGHPPHPSLGDPLDDWGQRVQSLPFCQSSLESENTGLPGQRRRLGPCGSMEQGPWLGELTWLVSSFWSASAFAFQSETLSRSVVPAMCQGGCQVLEKKQ